MGKVEGEEKGEGRGGRVGGVEVEGRWGRRRGGGGGEGGG